MGRFPIIHQHDATDCGPAVLAMISAYHGKQTSIARLRELAGTDRQGTTLAGLIAAAERAGFDARGVRATFDALVAAVCDRRFRFGYWKTGGHRPPLQKTQLQLPAVAHWREDNRNHFVVLYDVTSRDVTLGDPARGLRRLPHDVFVKSWTGILLLLTPTVRLRDALEKPRTSIARLCTLLLPHSRLFLDALLAAVLMTVLGLTSSFFIQALVDVVFVLGRKPALNWLGLGMLLVLVFRSAFLGLRSCLLAHLSQRLDADTVLGYHRHLLGLPLSFFSTRRTGEILSRMSDAVKIRVAVSATTLAVLVDSLLIVAAAALMLWMEWRIALAAVSLIPIVLVTMTALGRPMKRYQRTAMEKAAELESCVVETIGSMTAVKAWRAESRMQVATEARLRDLLDAGLRAQMLAAHTVTCTAFAAGLASLALLWLGAHQVLDGAMTVGRLMALHTMFGMLLAPLERLSGANQSIQDALVAAERLGEVIELEPERSAERESAIDRRVSGSVEFRGVSFRYGGRAPIFEDVSFEVAAGECVGISGASGCGKTSLVSLLGRFYEPSSGAVLIDGIDVRDYTFDCLRREVAFVPQEIVLMNASIAENIRLGRPEASAAEVREAARTVNVDAFATRLASGYDTLVGERGLALSGGERQRVALARAVLADPAILVMDEPTSHLDAESETAVESLLESRRGRRTTIVISHRRLGFDRLVRMGENHPVCAH